MIKKLPSKSNKPKEEEKINTLLVDGNALFKTGYHGAKNLVNYKGEPIGGVYQFLTMLRKLMNETVYHNIYVFWDGEFSGRLRYAFYPDYKSKRNKVYDGDGTRPVDDEQQIIQRLMVQTYLEELFIKQLEDCEVESDDFIAYYTLNKKENEHITICTNDSDICQLIKYDNVRIYKCDKKLYIDRENFKDVFGYHYLNVVLVKTIVGDTTDTIKGVKGVGEKGFLEKFGNVVNEPTTLINILETAFKLNEERIANKQKPLVAYTNIINGISDGDFSGADLYEVNDRLTNLSKPLLTESSIRNLEELVENKLVGDRGIKNALSLIKEHGIVDKIGDHNLDDYLLTYKKFIERHNRL